MSRTYLVVGEAVFVAVVLVMVFFMFRQPAPIPNAVRTEIKLPDSRAQVYLQRDAGKGYQYLISHPNGVVEKVSADQLAEQLYRAGNGGWFTAIGGSSPIVLFWLGIGLMGQVLFTGRM